MIFMEIEKKKKFINKKNKRITTNKDYNSSSSFTMIPTMASLIWTVSTILFFFLTSNHNKSVVALGGAGGDDAAASNRYLYLADDEGGSIIRDFTGKLSKNDFTLSTKPKVVEFYSPFCGHCKRFKSKYVDIATEIRQKDPSIEFYGVSCAAHLEICKEYKTNGIPYILMFPDGAPSNSEGGQNIRSTEFNVESVSQFFKGASTTAITTTTSSSTTTSSNTQYQQRPQLSSAQAMDEKRILLAQQGTGSMIVNKPPANANTLMQRQQIPEFSRTADAQQFAHGGSKVATDAVHARKPRTDHAARAALAAARARRNQNPVQDAGAKKAKEQSNELDKFKDILAKKKKVQARREKFKTLRKKRSKPEKAPKLKISKKGNDGNAAATAGAGVTAADTEGETKTMKAFKPGTAEYETRMKVIKDLKTKKKAFQKNKKNLGFKTSKNLKVEKAKEEDLKKLIERKKKFEEALARGKEIQEQKKLAMGSGEEVATTSTAATENSAALPAPPNVGIVKDIKKVGFVQKQVEKIPVVRKIYKMTPEEELISDASLAFVQSLQFGVYSDSNPLSNSKKAALSNWLQLVSVSIPPEWKLHELISDLLDNIDFISTSHRNLKELMNKHKRPRSEFSKSCKPKKTKSAGVGTASSKMQGFGCGFWKLLHLITIGVAEHRGGLNLIESGARTPDVTQTFSPIDAADTIRDYIQNFYSCTTCRDKFISRYDQCNLNRRCYRLTDNAESATGSDWQELAKWMWEVHNSFNIEIMYEKKALKDTKKGIIKSKLFGENSSQEDEINVLYPALDTCFKCYKDDGSFCEDNVFLFLEKTYWYGFEVENAQTTRLLQFDDKEEYSSIVSSWAFVIALIGVLSIVTRNPRNNILLGRVGSKAKHAD